MDRNTVMNKIRSVYKVDSKLIGTIDEMIATMNDMKASTDRLIVLLENPPEGIPPDLAMETMNYEL